MKKIIIILVLFCITGCYDYKELNQINIVSSVGIDYINNEYEVSLEIVNSEKDGSGTKLSTEIVKGVDKNVAVAFNNAVNASSKEIYLEHLKLLIISKDVAKLGINNIIDFTIRDIHLTNKFTIVLTDNIDNLYNIEIDNDIVSSKIVDMLENVADKKKIEDVDIMASHLLSHDKDIALPIIEIKDDELVYLNIGCFDDDKLVNVIDNKIYNFMIFGNNKITFLSDNNVIMVYKKKIKYDVRDGEVKILIEGYGEAKEIDSKYDLKKEDDYIEIERLINKEIENEVNEFIDDTYDSYSDLLGFNGLYYRKYKSEEDYIKYDVTSNIKLSKNGTLFEVLND